MPSQSLFFPCLKNIKTRWNCCNCASSSGVKELPPAVILQILRKLPIKSIIRFRLVCKSWLNIISDPYFAKVYLENPPFTVLALSQHRKWTFPVDEGSFYFIEIGKDGTVIRTPINSKAINFQKTGSLAIMGSCNGLLCLVQSRLPEKEDLGNFGDHVFNNQTVYIVNPVMGERIVLPKDDATNYVCDVIYGIGSSKDNAHYKVIKFVVRYMSPNYGREVKVDGKIITIGVDKKWRDIEDSSIPRNLFPSGINLNGVVHWAGDDGRHSTLIYAFDIEEESRRHIPLPPGLGDDIGNIAIASWNGNLCLADNRDKHMVTIWTMREYGVVESWTRDFNLTRRFPYSLYAVIPVGIMRNGELLMSRGHGQSLFSFDPKTRSCNSVTVPNDEGRFSFLFEYVPSFLSLKTFF